MTTQYPTQWPSCSFIVLVGSQGKRAPRQQFWAAPACSKRSLTLGKYLKLMLSSSWLRFGHAIDATRLTVLTRLNWLSRTTTLLLESLFVLLLVELLHSPDGIAKFKSKDQPCTFSRSALQAGLFTYLLVCQNGLSSMYCRGWYLPTATQLSPLLKIHNHWQMVKPMVWPAAWPTDLTSSLCYNEKFRSSLRRWRIDAQLCLQLPPKWSKCNPDAIRQYRLMVRKSATRWHSYPAKLTCKINHEGFGLIACWLLLASPLLMAPESLTVASPWGISKLHQHFVCALVWRVP